MNISKTSQCFIMVFILRIVNNNDIIIIIEGEQVLISCWLNILWN